MSKKIDALPRHECLDKTEAEAAVLENSNVPICWASTARLVTKIQGKSRIIVMSFAFLCTGSCAAQGSLRKQKKLNLVVSFPVTDSRTGSSRLLVSPSLLETQLDIVSSRCGGLGYGKG